MKLYKTLTKIAKQRATIPVLNRIRVKNGTATVTDLDMYLHVPCGLDDGLYHAHGFDKGIVIPDKEIGLDDFPEPRKPGKVAASLVFTKPMLDLMAWVLEAASRDETRYYLNGIYVDAENVIAADGYRLHSFKHTGLKKFPGALLPRAACKTILELVAETKADSVALDFAELDFRAQIGLAVLEGRLIDGTFPDYKKVIPSDYPAENITPFNAAQVKLILPALDILAKVYGADKSRYIKLGAGVIRAAGLMEKSKMEWPCSTVLPFEIGFNAKFLAEQCSGVIHYKDSAHPIIIRDKRGGIEKTGVVMPLRV